MNNVKSLKILILIMILSAFTVNVIANFDIRWESKRYREQGVVGDLNQYDWYVEGYVEGYYQIGSGDFIESMHGTVASDKWWFEVISITHIGPDEVHVWGKAYLNGVMVDYDHALSKTSNSIEIVLNGYDKADKVMTKSYAYMVWESNYWYVWFTVDDWEVWIYWDKLTLR